MRQQKLLKMKRMPCFLSGRVRWTWVLLTVKNAALAISYFNVGLEYYTPDEFPFEFISISNNNGAAHMMLSFAVDTVNNLNASEKILRRSLEILKRENYVNEINKTIFNLGNIYYLRSKHENVVENLNKAIENFRSFRDFYSKGKNINNYTLAIMNIGSAYTSLAEAGETEFNCQKAIECFEEAQNLRSSEEFPVQY